MSIEIFLSASICGHVCRYFNFNDRYYANFGDLMVSAIDISKVFMMPSMVNLDVDSSLCHDFNMLRRVNVSVVPVGVTYYTTPLTFNSFMTKTLETAFGIRKSYYRHVFSHMFRPTDAMLNQLFKYRHEHEFDRKVVVSLHLRTGGDFRDDMPDSDWQHYMECADYLTARIQERKRQRLGGSARPVAWFVAADTAKARDKAMQLFSRNGTVEVLFFGEYKISNTPAGVQSAWLDMLLVTAADARVLTPASSYSEFAWSMAHTDRDVDRQSVFVKSSTSTGPHMCYAETEPITPELPFCVRPCTPDPSFEDIEKIVKHAGCPSHLPYKPSVCPWTKPTKPLHATTKPTVAAGLTTQPHHP
jgi:hypothetical protein